MNPYHILRAAAIGNMRRNGIPLPWEQKDMSNDDEISCIDNEGGENTLAGWGEVIRKQGEERRMRQQKLQDELDSRTPDLIIRPPGADYEHGYWKADDGCGVVRYERFEGGKWMLNTKTSFSTQEIKALASML